MEFEKNKQLTSLLFIVKLLSVFFSAIPLFQRLFVGVAQNQQSHYNQYIIIIVSLLIFSGLLLFLMLIYHNSQKPGHNISWLEFPLFIILSFVAIGASGWNQSYYKFLFIFIIVSSSIEYTIKAGLIISGVASVILIAIDYVFVPAGNINIYFENDLALIAMFVTIAITVGLYSQIEREHIAYWKNSSYIDSLTEIFNQRYFFHELEKQCQISKKENRSLSLIMMDIDYFKQYNDMYGHQKGDQVLHDLAMLMKQHQEPQNILCRYGGEEFCMILPNSELQAAVKQGEDIRRCVAEFPFEGEEAMPFGRLTISMGVAQMDFEHDSYQALIQQADAALYRAKYLRRNRVEIYASIIDEFHKNNPEMNTNPKAFHTLKTLIAIINSRDSYTYHHIERVVQYCVIAADYLKLSANDKRNLIYAAYLHDLGKINIDKDILISSKKLTDEEWEKLKCHPKDGAEIIQKVGSLSEVVPIVLQHHERYGGGGYPNNLKGEEICYLARILTIADSFDAMTNERPYNRKRSFEEAYDEICRCAGTQFDPHLVDQFIDAIKSATIVNR